MSEPVKQDILDAHQRIKSYIHRTPVLSSQYLNSLMGGSIHFKCQNMQKTGSFKVRGAANKIVGLPNPSILCAHSSGNHAQAVSYVARALGLKAYIVMPCDTPQVKKNAVAGYDAKIFESGPTVPDQEALSSKVSKQYNADLIHPYNDWKIMAGAATSALELYQDHSDFDYLVVPIGGGGLCSGSLLATKYFSPKTKVIGVEPELARDAKDSMQKGSPQPQYPPLTLGEGVRTNIGDKTFSVMKQYLADIVLVSELEMIEAARLFQERMKIVVELSGTIVLAAILKDNRFRGKKVGAILSGGNMNFASYFESLRSKL